MYTMYMSDAMPVRDVREQLASVVDKAAHRDTPTIITRHGREVAAVVSIEMLREWERWEEEHVAGLIDERMAADDGDGVSLADVMAETLARDE
jgi:prevent-host-death family protein